MGATERYAVTGVGAPSYTSGVQKWKGTAEILYPNPARMKIEAIIKAKWEDVSNPASAFCISKNFVVPVRPNKMLNPKSIKHDAIWAPFWGRKAGKIDEFPGRKKDTKKDGQKTRGRKLEE